MGEFSGYSGTDESARHERLLQLRERRFPHADRVARIERALDLLRTMPDTIRLSPDDARWIAENPQVRA